MKKDAKYFRELTKSKQEPRDEYYIEKSREIVLKYIESNAEKGLYSALIDEVVFTSLRYNNEKLDVDKLLNACANDNKYYEDLGFDFYVIDNGLVILILIFWFR